MSEKFIRAEEVAEVMEISVPYAYKIIRKLNQELSDKGYIIVTGRDSENRSASVASLQSVKLRIGNGDLCSRPTETSI